MKDFKYWRRRYDLCCWVLKVSQVDAVARREPPFIQVSNYMELWWKKTPIERWWARKLGGYRHWVRFHVGRWLGRCAKEMTALNRQSDAGWHGKQYAPLEAVYARCFGGTKHKETQS